MLIKKQIIGQKIINSSNATGYKINDCIITELAIYSIPGSQIKINNESVVTINNTGLLQVSGNNIEINSIEVVGNTPSLLAGANVPMVIDYIGYIYKEEDVTQ